LLAACGATLKPTVMAEITPPLIVTLSCQGLDLGTAEIEIANDDTRRRLYPTERLFWAVSALPSADKQCRVYGFSSEDAFVTLSEAKLVSTEAWEQTEGRCGCQNLTSEILEGQFRWEGE